MSESSLAQLGAIRAEIAAIDDQLIQLLKERSVLSHRIGVIKNDHNLPVRDALQERDIYAKLAEAARKAGLEGRYVKAIFQAIIDESVRLQAKLRR